MACNGPLHPLLPRTRSCVLSADPTAARFCATIPRFDIACRAACTMEINPYLNRMKDLTERTESLRGYL